MRKKPIVTFCSLLSFTIWNQACTNPGNQRLQEVVAATGGRIVAAPTQDESIRAAKEALRQGVEKGVGQLTQSGGFAASSHRMLVPPALQQYADLARRSGLGSLVDSFEASLNRAADEAVAQATPIFAKAITELQVKDVVDILQGPDDAATQYFKRTTSTELLNVFLPSVKRATESAGVTRVYKQFMTALRPAALLAGLEAPAVDLDRYVADRSLDALFQEVAREEKKVRAEPLAQGSALLKKVFGFYAAKPSS